MKKGLVITLILLLFALVFTSCSQSDSKTILVGASPTPHAEILEVAKELLAKEGYELKIKEFTDYVQPNTALDSGDLDANFFQHQQYLDDFNEKNGTKLVSVANIHYEPFGIYSDSLTNLADLADGAKVSVPSDPTNEARALLLLEAQGLIKLDSDAGISATVNDITENPKGLNIVELEAAQLPRSLADVDIAVINGNYAMQADLSPSGDAIAIEEMDSLAATTYVNVIAVRKGDEDKDSIKALVKALKSDEVKQFMEEKFDGAVVPIE